MVKKRLTCRLSVVSCFTFLLLFVVGFSCKFHEVPEQPGQPELAKIKTVSAVYDAATNIFFYTVQFENLGNMTVKEYGIVSYAGEPGENHVPVAPAAPYVFPFYERQYAFTEFIPATLNAVTINRAYDQKENKPTRLFYRAYAIHSDNKVVYGEVKYVDFETEKEPVIKTLDAIMTDQTEVELNFKVQFSSLGNVPVYQYGIVVEAGSANEPKTPHPSSSQVEVVTFNGSSQGPAVKNLNLDIKSKTVTINPITSVRVFYRAFARLNNGKFVIGEVKFVDILVK